MSSVALAGAEQPLVLALDIGTSSTRALLFDRRGRVVEDSESQKSYDLTATAEGGAYVDADFLTELTVSCVDQALECATTADITIAAVGMSTFWHSLMGLDANWIPTTPVLLWADTRAGDAATELRRTIDVQSLRDLTGCVIHSSYWPAKLRWLKSSDPGLFARTTRWCSFADYFLWRMTGADCTSVSMASGTGLLDVREGNWSLPAIEVAGISLDSLPVIGPDEGQNICLEGQFGKRWPILSDACWLPGYGDGACANAGTNAFDSNRIALSLGTSGAMRVAVEAPSGSSFEIPDDLWAYRLDHKRVVFGAAISNGGKVLAWLSELLNVDFDSETMELAGELEPDRHKLTFLPFLAGERSPIWNDHATAVIAGLTLSTGKVELVRAGMESVALRFARLYVGLKRVAADDHEIVANGAALLKSPVWQQITADALNHPIVALPPEEESSARGAAVLALLHTGTVTAISELEDPARGAPRIESIERNIDAYRLALARQTKLEKLLFVAGSSWDSN